MGTDDVEAALSEYSRRWLPSAHAVVELTEEGFGGNRRAFTLNLKLVQVSGMVLGAVHWPAALGGRWREAQQGHPPIALRPPFCLPPS